MSLKEKIQSDFIVSMKEKNIIAKSALSGLKSKITEAEKSNGNIELNDSEVIKVVVASIKQRKQSVVEFVKGNRQDLADKENGEIEILSNYLPSQMNEVEVEIALGLILSQLPSDGNKMKLVGQTIGTFNKMYQGRADNTVVKKIVELLVS